MDPIFYGLALIVLLLGILATGFWIGLSLTVVAWVSTVLLTDAPAGKVMATSMWQMLASWELVALPLFIWMGEILYRTKLAADMFEALAPWLSRLPGRLLHLNVVGCGIFAAVSGSSAATTATIGRMNLPQLEMRGYNRSLSYGSLAASGGLGILIPPSIPMIVYGVAAQVSIMKLFIAGVLPAILVIALFMAYIAIRAYLNPKLAPEPPMQRSLVEKLKGSVRLLPVMLLIVGVIGSIYSGIATPTEAAGVGVLGSLAICLYNKALTKETLRASIEGAVRTTSMICLLLAGSAFLTLAMGFTGVPKALSQLIAELGLSPGTLILALAILYVVLGCFLDGISMIVLTVSVVLPMVQSASIDLVWFGVFLILVIEMSQITPPVGFNLFVVQGVTGASLGTVARASFPFFILMAVTALILTIFPQIVTWLPSLI